MFEKLLQELREILSKEHFRRFSNAEAKRIGDRIGIDWKKIPIGEFRSGLTVELEHGSWDKQLDVTHNDLVKTGRIALAHLREDPKYYTRLRKAGVKDVPPTD